jgi:hypothetical protein
VSGWPKRRKLAHAFLREYSDERLKLAQLLGKLGVFLTQVASHFWGPPRLGAAVVPRPE